MSAYASSRSPLSAYQSVAAHGGVAADDPHRLIVMLLDGALERIAGARGAIQHGQLDMQAALIHRAVAILDELRSSLNLDAGGQIAANLRALYEYGSKQLMKGSLENRVEPLEEVARLLGEIRAAWIAMPTASRRGGM